MPNEVVASDLELLVYNWLTQKRITFEFQSQMIGGYIRSLGDAIVDFLLTDLNILLRVQGEYWHTDIKEVARDRIQKAALESMGYIVVDLWESDIKENLDYIMSRALVGQGRELGS